jgi:hypothetical protein
VSARRHICAADHVLGPFVGCPLRCRPSVLPLVSDANKNAQWRDSPNNKCRTPEKKSASVWPGDTGHRTFVFVQRSEGRHTVRYIDFPTSASGPRLAPGRESLQSAHCHAFCVMHETAPQPCHGPRPTNQGAVAFPLATRLSNRHFSSIAISLMTATDANDDH